MKLLLDTHTLIWFLQDDPKLSLLAGELVENPKNKVFVSVVTLWEIAIKVSLGKLVLSTTFDQVFPQQLLINNFEVLPIEIIHLKQVMQLPFHHGDPFDRLLMAQSMVEQLAIVGRDKIFDSYNVKCLW
jgi:PIN domain nuclease of toxin-antitoxin system